VTSTVFGTNSSEVVLLHNTLVSDLVTVIQSALPGIVWMLPVMSNFSSVLIVFHLLFTGIALGDVNLHSLCWQKEANAIEEETTGAV
jgi:hypothetical protein